MVSVRAAPYLLQIPPSLFSPRSSSVFFFAGGGNVAASELRPVWTPPTPPPFLWFSRRQPRAFRVPVSASPRRGPPRRKDSFDSDEDDGLWEDDDEEEKEEGDVSGEPLEEMRRWLVNKPAGFGVGKTYDTSLEDELWKEMERSRKAQVANLNKLTTEEARKKENQTKVSEVSEDHPTKKQPQKKAANVIASGARVRIWNLPKKKNIHRDLHLAFKGFPGLVSINPAVSGNEKTRDPICKGYAFLDLSSEEAAYRFVQVYSKKSLLFGKVQKQIDCGIINQNHVPKPVMLSAAIELEEPILNENKESPLAHSAPRETCGEQVNVFVLEDYENGSETEVISMGSDDFTRQLQKQKKQKALKKKTVKRVSLKPSNSSLPGSAARLKIKERTVLTGVFSKYGGKGVAGDG